MDQTSRWNVGKGLRSLQFLLSCNPKREKPLPPLTIHYKSVAMNPDNIVPKNEKFN